MRIEPDGAVAAAGAAAVSGVGAAVDGAVSAGPSPGGVCACPAGDNAKIAAAARALYNGVMSSPFDE
jgi:hypothetical protein